MGSEERSSTGVTRIEPPQYQLPFLQHGVGQSRSLYEGGPQQFYPGNSIVPFAPQSERALQMQTDRALQGSPVTSAAQNLATQTLGGGFLGGNPWLDNAFNRAADATRSQLDTQFAGAGRNLAAQQPFRAEQLNNLATDFYFGNYNAERDRQMGTLPIANQLAQADYADIGQLRDVGAQVEGMTGQVIDDRMNRFNFAQGAPGQSLDDYLRRVSLNMGQTQTQTTPMYRNRTSGAIGGAMAGAQLGSMFAPGWGTGIGAGLGLLGGLI